jgi:hypothetical protein
VDEDLDVTCSAANPCEECREKMVVLVKNLKDTRLRELTEYTSQIRDPREAAIVQAFIRERLENNLWFLNSSIPVLVKFFEPQLKELFEKEKQNVDGSVG